MIRSADDFTVRECFRFVEPGTEISLGRSAEKHSGYSHCKPFLQDGRNVHLCHQTGFARRQLDLGVKAVTEEVKMTGLVSSAPIRSKFQSPLPRIECNSPAEISTCGIATVEYIKRRVQKASREAVAACKCVVGEVLKEGGDGGSYAREGGQCQGR